MVERGQLDSVRPEVLEAGGVERAAKRPLNVRLHGCFALSLHMVPMLGKLLGTV